MVFNRDIKENYTISNLKERMLKTTTNIVNQGCNKMRTFIDVDSIIGLSLEAALDVKHMEITK